MESKIIIINKLIRKNPAIFAIILFFVFIIISSLSLVAYAYFTASVTGEGKQITLNTSNAIVNFIDNDVVNKTGITPGVTITKTFSVTNTTKGSLKYKINWEYLTNNLSYRSALKYTITSTGGGGVLSSTQVPDSGDHINIINNITIPGNTTQNYTMTITYEDNGQNQDADKNKSLIGKLEVTNIEGNSVLPTTSTETYTPPASTENIFSFSPSDLIKRIYPVGSIYTSTSNTNPGTLFPGTTWEAYAPGRVLVGVGTITDSNNKNKTFSVGNTGGLYNAIVPYHSHNLNGEGASATSAGAHEHSFSGTTSTTGSAHTHSIAANGLSVRMTSTTNITTAAEASHTHSLTGSGKLETGKTTGAGTAHTHNFNIPSLDIPSGGAHTHTTTATSEAQSLPSNCKIQDLWIYLWGEWDDYEPEVGITENCSIGSYAAPVILADTNGNNIVNTPLDQLDSTEEATIVNYFKTNFGQHNATIRLKVNGILTSDINIPFGEEGEGYWYEIQNLNVQDYVSGSSTSLQLTTGSESSHTHTIAARTITSKNAALSLTGGAHNHSLFEIWSDGSGSEEAYVYQSDRKLTTRYTETDGAHTHTFNAGVISVKNTNAVTTGAGTPHYHTFNIPALSIASSGSHTHTTVAKNGNTTSSESSHIHSIPSLNLSVTGQTTTDNHAGAHIHSLVIPALTSKNSAITVPNTNSGHSHTISGTATSGGAHEHALSGNTGYAGTSGNTTNANLQPYITVYRWRRVS